MTDINLVVKGKMDARKGIGPVCEEDDYLQGYAHEIARMERKILAEELLPNNNEVQPDDTIYF